MTGAIGKKAVNWKGRWGAEVIAVPCGKDNVFLFIRAEYQASTGQGTAEVWPIAGPVFFAEGGMTFPIPPPCALQDYYF
jgi:hypothetical protein